MSSIYRYSPLDSDQRQIRVLGLQPAEQKSSPIDLSIRHISLNDPGEYSALSYTWGPSNPKFNITLNQRDFEVAENLFVALQHIRDPKSHLSIWIDAICINQDDISERESQVRQMQYIYAGAKQVLAWTGPEITGREAKAFELIELLKLDPILSLELVNDGTDVKGQKQQMINSITPPAFQNSAWLDLIDFLERPWFSRVWIIQEVIMGTSVLILCGRLQISWESLYHATVIIEKHQTSIVSSCLGVNDFDQTYVGISERGPEQIVRLTRSYQRPWAIGEHKRQLLEKPWFLNNASNRIKPNASNTELDNKIPQHGSESMLIQTAPEVSDLLPYIASRELKTPQNRQSESSRIDVLYSVFNRYKGWNSTDPRDKLYALMGLVAPALESQKPAPPPIDYSITPSDVFLNLIDYQMQVQPSVEFLAEAWGIRRPAEYSSWMPSLRLADELFATPIRLLEFFPLSVFKTSMAFSPAFKFDRDCMRLGLAAAAYFRITVVGGAAPRGVKENETEHVYSNWAELLGIKESWSETLSRVLANRDRGDITEAELNNQYRAEDFLQMLLMCPIQTPTVDQLVGILTEPVRNDAIFYQRDLYWAAVIRREGACVNRRLFILANGVFGLGPSDMQAGDFLVLLLGSKTPHVIRPVEDDINSFQLVGEAFVVEFMDGMFVADLIQNPRPDNPAKYSDERLVPGVLWLT